MSAKRDSPDILILIVSGRQAVSPYIDSVIVDTPSDPARAAKISKVSAIRAAAKTIAGRAAKHRERRSPTFGEAWPFPA